jgi:hypothetical protein
LVIQGQLGHKESKVWLAILALKGQLDLKEMLELRVALGQLDRKAI